MALESDICKWKSCFTSYWMRDKLSNISEPQFPFLCNGFDHTSSGIVVS